MADRDETPFACSTCGAIRPAFELETTWDPRYRSGKCRDCGKTRAYAKSDKPLPPETARARRTDPDTSHEAGKSVKGMSETRAAILRLLRAEADGLTDPDIWDRLDIRDRTSVSGIRTRRAELVEMGFVEDSGRRAKGATGRRMIVWVAIP